MGFDQLLKCLGFSLYPLHFSFTVPLNTFIMKDKLERRKWGRPGTKVGKKEVEDVRRREEEKLRLFLINQDKARIEERGEREKKCVGLTMEKEEGRREEIERRKVVAIAEVNIYFGRNWNYKVDKSKWETTL